MLDFQSRGRKEADGPGDRVKEQFLYSAKKICPVFDILLQNF